MRRIFASLLSYVRCVLDRTVRRPTPRPIRSALSYGLCLCAGLPISILAEEGEHTVADVREQVSVARVNNQSISLADLELTLMEKEGADIIEDLVRKQLKKVDWSLIKDDDIVVSVCGLEIPRVRLASVLLDQQAAEIREMLIQQLLIQQSLTTAGIVLNQELKDEMLKRMERRHYAAQELSGSDTTVAFDSLIQQQYGMSPQEWQQDPGFAFLAGTFALMYQTMEIPQGEIERYFEDHKKRYGVSEGYKLSLIPFNFKNTPQKIVNESTKEITRRRARDSFKSVGKSSRNFDRHLKFSRANDREKRGFVSRLGVPEIKATQHVPEEVMEAVFRHQYTEFPTILAPIEHKYGLTIVRVEAYRKGQRAIFDQCRVLVRKDLVDSDTKRWMSHFLRTQRNNADIEYGSLIDVKAERREDLMRYIQRKQAEIQGDDSVKVPATGGAESPIQ